MEQSEFRQKLCSLLSMLAKDMRVSLTKEEADHILNRVTNIVYYDMENSKSNKPLPNRIDDAFNNISRGNIDIRHLNVVSIMRCLKSPSYGIYCFPLSR